MRRGTQAIIGPEDGFISTWAFTPDSSAILYSGDTTQSWQADWFLYDLDTNETRRLTDDLRVSVDGGFPTVALPAQPVWLNDDQVIYHGFSRGQSGIYRLTVSSGAHEELYTWPAVHAGFSVDEERNYIVQVRSTPTHLGRGVQIAIGSGEIDVLDEPNAEYFYAQDIGPWERITIERGGLELDGWLLLPPEFDSSKHYPLVLDIHGGPNSHHGPGFNATQQALAGAGFAVLFTNPRGSIELRARLHPGGRRRLGRRGLPRPDGLPRPRLQAALHRCRSGRRLWLQLRRLYDELDRRPHRPVQGGGDRRAGGRSRLVLWDGRHRAHLRPAPGWRHAMGLPGGVPRAIAADESA